MRDLGAPSFRFTVLAVLFLAALFAAMPALRGELLSYDDRPLLLGTGHADGALERSALSFLTGKFYYAYLPVYGLSLWLDGQLGASAENTLLFHLQNVFWHAAASYVLFLLLGLLLKHRWAAFLGALLFAVHPLHVESVAWIAGRKDVVSGFFFLLAWLLALLAEQRRALLFPALVSFGVACLAKASPVVLPLVLVAAALLLPRYRGRRGEAIARTWPFFVVAAGFALLHLLVGVEAEVVSGARPLGARLLGFAASWGGAVQRTLFPFDLSIDYPEAHATEFAELAWPASLLVAALLVVPLLRRRAPVAAFGVAAFFVALLPFNNVFPSTAVLAADRYLYLSLAGPALVVGWAATRSTWAGGAAGVVALLCLALSATSAGRFRSDEELWTRTIEARDDSALAYVNRGLDRTTRALATARHDRELLRDGVADLEKGFARARLDEHRAKAALGLVVPLLELGEVQSALERADDALEHVTGDSPDARRFRAQIHFNKGVVLKLGARADVAAAKEFLASARLWARYQAWYEAGTACLRGGLLDEGRAALERAAALDRTAPEPHLQLANIARQLDDRNGQRRALEEAERRAPRNMHVAAAWINYWLDDRAPNYRRAEEHLAKLPDSAAKRSLVAAVDAERALFHFRRGDLEEALAAADAARGGAAGLADPRALYDLGQIYLEAQRYDDAVACYASAGGDEAARRDAIARALTLKAAARVREGDEAGALAAMREALTQRPALVDAGAAPLRAELDDLREAEDERLLLLAASAAAGDAAEATRLGDELLAGEMARADRRLFYRLRALVRGWVGHDYQGAEDDLRHVLSFDESDAWARYRLAQVLTRRGLRDRQSGLLQGDEELRRRGEALVDEAIRILSEVLEEKPEFHLARLARGEARFARDDLSGAKADYLALRERGAKLKEVYLKEAVLHRLAYVQGGDAANLEAATNLLQLALARDPNYFEALFELGNVHHNLYDRPEETSSRRKMAFNRALLWYRRAMALNPRMRAPRVEWARLCLKVAREAMAAQEPRQAHELLLRLEAEAADVPDVHRERVRLALQPEFGRETGIAPEEVFERAARALEALERLSPADPELPALRALYHRRRGWSFYLTWVKLPEGERKERARALAVEEFKAAVSASPDDPENARVRDLLREVAPEVIVLDEDQARRAFEEGVRAYEEGRWEDAAGSFRRAVLLFPESVDLRYSYALALLRAGREDEARDELQLVANHEEGDRHPDALYELGRLYLRRGQGLIARPWLERFVATMERLGRGDDPLVESAKRELAGLGGG